VSFEDGDGNNICDEPDEPDGLHPLARHFLAGVLEHGPGMMVFFNPTVNAYRRINAEALVPTRLCWGHDHRMTLIRVPSERGSATRLEIRLGEAGQRREIAVQEAEPVVVVLEVEAAAQAGRQLIDEAELAVVVAGADPVEQGRVDLEAERLAARSGHSGGVLEAAPAHVELQLGLSLEDLHHQSGSL